MSNLHFTEEILHGVILKLISLCINTCVKMSELRSVFLKLSLTYFLAAL